MKEKTLHADVQKIVDMAMDGAAESLLSSDAARSVLKRNEGKADAQFLAELTTNAERDESILIGALSVLANVLDAAGYDVQEPYIHSATGFAPSNERARAELDKWIAGRKAVTA